MKIRIRHSQIEDSSLLIYTRYTIFRMGNKNRLGAVLSNVHPRITYIIHSLYIKYQKGNESVHEYNTIPFIPYTLHT